MRIRCINLVTLHVDVLRDFYSRILRLPWDESHGGPGRCEIQVGEVCLVLCHTEIPPVVHPESCGLEFEVDDVDAEYARLVSLGVSVSEPPVTYPWGFRAIGFRDPDGNHIDFVQQLR